MGRPTSSTTSEVFIHAQQTAISTELHLPKVREWLFDVYSILKRAHLENHLYHINNLHQKCTMGEKSNGDIAFLDTLLKRNNGKISVLICGKFPQTDQYLHYTSHHQTSCKHSVASSFFDSAYLIIMNIDDLIKENTLIKQMLKYNLYQEIIISKNFIRITNNHSFSQS